MEPVDPLLIDERVLEFTPLSDYESQFDRMNFTWDAISFTQSIMEVQFDFEFPLEISQYFERDEIQLRVINSTYFVSRADNVTVPNYISTRRSIPPQVLPGGEIKTVEAATILTESTLLAFLASNVLFNTVGIGVINMFWGLVNSLQLIAYVPLHAIILPANSKVAYELTYSIAAFDLIPTDPLTDALEGPLEDLDNTDSHNIHCSETAQEMEYDSANPIMNLILAFGIALVIIL